ncbi:hypothetical protein AVEN_65105-1 [Araneus ventricosus]|uniref:Uncharacterized protein n=1 Tax=Araneus ventricosus TaxID=182803 RepID=A0A4Y2GGY7_ARAVE|nr:hypothetical protein AVEN_65105-1 [Araneus ventricosus]
MELVSNCNMVEITEFSFVRKNHLHLPPHHSLEKGIYNLKVDITEKRIRNNLEKRRKCSQKAMEINREESYGGTRKFNVTLRCSLPSTRKLLLVWQKERKNNLARKGGKIDLVANTETRVAQCKLTEAKRELRKKLNTQIVMLLTSSPAKSPLGLVSFPLYT